MAKLLLVLPSIDARLTAPLPVLPSTIRIRFDGEHGVPQGPSYFQYTSMTYHLVFKE